MDQILVYGAYGYTGILIVEEGLKSKLPLILAGRNEEKLEALAARAGLPYVCFDLSEESKLKECLQNCSLVIHCAGPFEFTAEVMARACLETRTDYIDITGEFTVFEWLRSMDGDARNKDVMLLPGAGFDVVPSDCLASKLKEQMPDGTHLELAFTSVGGHLSRGTTKTMIENIHRGQYFRKDGKLVSVPLGAHHKTIDFGAVQEQCVGISWGDISTAHYSTGIPNIEVFTKTSPEQLSKFKLLKWLGFIFKIRPIKKSILKNIDKKPAGPSREQRNKSNVFLWGKISNGADEVEMRMEVPNGYSLTAKTVVLIAAKIMKGNKKSGFQTPSTAYGSDIILEVEGCKLI